MNAIENEPRYDIVVKLTSRDGNAFAVLGEVRKQLKKAGAGPAMIQEFLKEATAGNYDELIQTCMRWVHVE